MGSAMIGVVLTAVLRDGTKGFKPSNARCRVLAQDSATARAHSMPSRAIATGCVDFVLPLHRIAVALAVPTMTPGAAELFTVPTPSWASLYA
jgi:two-component system chemotaxis response regulator CheB